MYKKIVTYNVSSNNSINIKDFGAHSITENGYSTFDSSASINKAIQYASTNNISIVDFGSGKYYADNISLRGNISYVATGEAELIAAPTSETNYAVLQGWYISNVKITGITINGNMNVIPGDIQSGHSLMKLIGCSNVIIQNCYLHDNWYLAIDLENGCEYITVENNKIYNTDAGVITLGTPSNYITVDNNEIYGGNNQHSEPVSIYNNGEQSLSHDITITNNLLHDKTLANGIQLRNTEKVLIKSNTIYNCAIGIGVGTAGIDPAFNHVEGEVDVIATTISITNNAISNCNMGMSVELENSLISDNVIHDIKGTGIWMSSPDGRFFSVNNTISKNTITNVNSGETGDTGIRLQYSKNCIIDSNTINDTRSTPLTNGNIQITGSSSINNIIQNNILGPTANNVEDINITQALNTIIKNNVSDIYTDNNTTVVVSNTAKNNHMSWLDPGNKTIVLTPSSNIVNMDSPNEVAYTTITTNSSWLDRQITLVFKRIKIMSLTSGGNLNLKGGSFIPSSVGDEITFVLNGNNWDEISRPK